MNIHDSLVHAVTEYDRKESTKRGYNRYALPQYIGRIQEIDEDLKNGADLRSALVAAFCGKRLLDSCLKAVGLPKSTDQDKDDGRWYYVPASARKA